MKIEYIRVIVRCLMEATEEQVRAVYVFVKSYLMKKEEQSF